MKRLYKFKPVNRQVKCTIDLDSIVSVSDVIDEPDSDYDVYYFFVNMKGDVTFMIGDTCKTNAERKQQELILKWEE